MKNFSALQSDGFMLTTITVPSCKNTKIRVYTLSFKKKQKKPQKNHKSRHQHNNYI